MAHINTRVFGFPAKQKRMIKNPCAEDPAILLSTPAHPMSGCEMIQNLKECLDSVECPPGTELLQRRFGNLIGAPKSTINDWSHGKLVEPIKRFICGLERLSETERSQFLNGICRRCPRLLDPQIAHDPEALRTLGALLNQDFGLTFVTGSDAARTYLVTAMGNSVAWRGRACGFDVHRPDAFVPVPGVSYLAAPCSLRQLRATFRWIWPSIMKSKCSLLLLNGIWGSLPEARLRIVSAAAKRHVVVADEPGLDLARVNWRRPINVILVRSTGGANERLHIAVEAVRSR